MAVGHRGWCCFLALRQPSSRSQIIIITHKCKWCCWGKQTEKKRFFFIFFFFTLAGWNWFRPLPTTKGVSVFLSVSRFGLGCGSVEWPFPVRFSLYIHFLFLIFSSSSTTSSPRLKGRRPPAISSWRLSAAVCRVLPLSITSGHRFLRFCYKRAQSGGWFFFLFFSLNFFFCRNSWRKKGGKRTPKRQREWGSRAPYDDSRSGAA